MKALTVVGGLAGRGAMVAACSVSLTLLGCGIGGGPAAAATTRTASPGAAAGGSTAEPAILRQGDSGADVRAVQRRLAELGYWVGRVDGRYGPLTTQAVYALQKAAGLKRDGAVGPATRAALERGVRPAASSRRGRVAEVDLRRQLLLLVRDGKVEKVFNTSTGSGQVYFSQGVRKIAVTPKGRYRVYRQVDAWDPGPLGALYRPRYFNGGIAVHGSGSIPAHPASHGCARVTNAAMDLLWSSGLAPVGTPVLVY